MATGLLEYLRPVTEDMDLRSEELLVSMMEDVASELEQSNPKPRDRYQSLENLIFRQSIAIDAFNAEVQEREQARTDAVSKLLTVVGLSVLASLVIVLLGIEANTRRTRA